MATTPRNKRTIRIESVEPRKYNNGTRNDRNQDVDHASDDSIDKLSNVTLSDEQVYLKDEIIKFFKETLANYQPGDQARVYVIKGGAGTGKSVVLNSLFNEVQRLNREVEDQTLANTNNYLVVNHPEMIRLYLRIAQSFPYLRKGDIERPTSYINQYDRGHPSKGESHFNDLVIVDEAHLLASCKNAYKKFFGENHLTEILRTCKAAVIVYDDKQTLRTDQYWEEGDGSPFSLGRVLERSCKEWREFELKQQFRMKLTDGTNDNTDVLEWVHRFCFENQVLPLPKERTGPGCGFEFKVFSNCQEMYERIVDKNRQYGQCRILSTYDYPYRISGNKEWYVTGSGGFKLPWDKFTPGHKVPWSERDYTIDEVGSVYTIQGFDLNYVGVVIGPSISVDLHRNTVDLHTSHHQDRAGTVNRAGIDRSSAVRRIIMNSLYVLLTRGVRGLYVYIPQTHLQQPQRSSSP